MTLLATMICCLMMVITVWVLWNVRCWPKHAVQGTGEPLPFVSVLVPARNEEAKLARCLESLLRQEYPSFEVICLDDRSEDATPDILLTLQQRYPKLAVLHGKPLPDGWVGKCHACHQLGEHAAGQWLLFTDADTVHAPGMLAAMVRTGLAESAGLVTGFPRVLSRHTFGWLVLPMLHFIITLHLPLRMAARSLDPRFTAAHGAFLLFRRTAYEQIGRHALHRASLIEDMTMAKAVKSAGFPVALTDITDHVSCEMYDRPADVWHGFTKNMFVGLGRSTPLLFGLLLGYFVLYILPLGLAVGALVQETMTLFWLTAATVLLSVFQKAAVDRKFGVPLGWSLLLPFSFLSIMAIALRSWYAAVSGAGYQWKGRRYDP
jgi:chlorobactene glucosyltransferase